MLHLELLRNGMPSRGRSCKKHQPAGPSNRHERRLDNCRGTTSRCLIRPPCMRSVEELRSSASLASQAHAFEFWEELEVQEQEELIASLQDVDLGLLARLHSASVTTARSVQSSLEPVSESQILTLKEQHSSASGSTVASNLLKRGLELIAEGKIATACLAGGQGTRLGSSDPKGLFDIGLPFHKSLFQIQIERLQQLQAFANQTSGKANASKQIPLVILTSPATDERTRQFFAENANFGLSKEQVLFAIQGELPCLQEDGRIILASKSRVAKAPDGNGGFYTALVKSGVLEELEARGVEYIDCYCVDNALARIADPLLAGQADLRQADACAKVLAKAYPEERVGVFVQQTGGAIEVVEYSELDPAVASTADPGTGRLRFNWANISHFCFTPAFIRKAAERLTAAGQYHLAKKTIPSVHGLVKGIKLESFIFDPFPLASNLQLVEVSRNLHFAPVKNANGASADTPDAAKEAVMRLSGRLSCSSAKEAAFLAQYALEEH